MLYIFTVVALTVTDTLHDLFGSQSVTTFSMAIFTNKYKALMQALPQCNMKFVFLDTIRAYAIDFNNAQSYGIFSYFEQFDSQHLQV